MTNKKRKRLYTNRGVALEHEKCASLGPAHLEDLGGYFFGVVWLVGADLVPERTERSPLARESMMVRPIEVSIKMIAE
jgi:hypothetical protein